MTDTLPPSTPEEEERALTVLTKGNKPHIRARLRDAIAVYVSEGLSIADSARRAGMTPHGLQVALKKPHVAAYVASVKREWMANRTSKSWTNIADLADNASSEDVRLKANRVFLEAAGELGGNANDAASMAKTLVQIIVNQGRDAAQLPDGQMRGVIESQPWRPSLPHPSNSDPVGRADSDDEEGA